MSSNHNTGVLLKLLSTQFNLFTFADCNKYKKMRWREGTEGTKLLDFMYTVDCQLLHLISWDVMLDMQNKSE